MLVWWSYIFLWRRRKFYKRPCTCAYKMFFCQSRGKMSSERRHAVIIRYSYSKIIRKTPSKRKSSTTLSFHFSCDFSWIWYVYNRQNTIYQSQWFLKHLCITHTHKYIYICLWIEILENQDFFPVLLILW